MLPATFLMSKNFDLKGRALHKIYSNKKQKTKTMFRNNFMVSAALVATSCYALELKMVDCTDDSLTNSQISKCQSWSPNAMKCTSKDEIKHEQCVANAAWA